MRQKSHLQEEKKLKLSIWDRSLTYRNQKNCTFLWDRSLTYREKKNCPSYETWARLHSENVNIHVKNFNILHLHEIHAPTFWLNKVALDSQFYNGDIKSYLLPFFLDPKNNFQTEISLHQILKSKISTDIWVLQKDKINNNLENLMILKSAFQLFQPWGEMSIIRVGVSYLMVFSSSQPQDPWVALDSQGLHYYLLSAAKITTLRA